MFDTKLNCKWEKLVVYKKVGLTSGDSIPPASVAENVATIFREINYIKFNMGSSFQRVSISS